MVFKAGKYPATVLSHGISETKSGALQAIVAFSFSYDGVPSKIVWYGHFTEKTKLSTIKGLIACGLKGNNPAGALEIGKAVQITIEVGKDQNGNPKSSVRWVNALGEVKSALAPDAAKAKLSALEGAVFAARQGLQAQMDDEIPF